MIKKRDPEALASFLDSSEASGTHRKISPDTLMELAFRFRPADEQLLREAIKRYLEIMEYGKLQPRQYANILKAIHASADWTDLLTEEDLCAIIREAAVYQKDRICAIDVFSNSFSALSSLGDWKTQAKEMEKLLKKLLNIV